MDERALIINAIKQKKNNTPDTSKVDKVDFSFPETDSLDKWIKRKKRIESFKRKSVKEWSNVDFLCYLDYIIKEFRITRARENIRRDYDKINKLYDQLAILIPTMDNMVLKNYMEWWCSIWATRLSGNELYLNLLSQSYMIDRFVKKYNKELEEFKEEKDISFQNKPVSAVVDDDSIYKLGGISLLIMKRGLVIGYRMLNKLAMPSPKDVVKQTVNQFNIKVLINVLKITIAESPYLQVDKVDFVSLASSALIRFGLNDYDHILYESYFKE